MNYSKENRAKISKQFFDQKKTIMSKLNISIIRILILTIVLISVISLSAVLGAVKGVIDSTPALDFKKIAPKGFITYIYDKDEKKLQELKGDNANREYISLDNIPKKLQDAFISIEDERFWTHNGIDIMGIMRAMVTNIKRGDFSEGASTLTQQLIKNNILSSTKTFERKIQEQYLALNLEKKMDKKMILENYLNTISLGKGTLGVKTAAKRYFNKDVQDLTLAECAVLASVTKSPTKYNPIDHPENNDKRKNLVLNNMLQQKCINEEEFKQAKKENVYDKIKNVDNKIEKQSSNSYFVDEVITRIVNDLQRQKGYTESEAYNLIYRGGLKIYTTQDSYMQKIVDNVIQYDKYNLYPRKNIAYGVTLKYRLSVQTSKGEVKHLDESTLKNYFRKNDKKFNLLFKNEDEANQYINKYRLAEANEKAGDKILGETISFTPQPQASMVIMDHHNGHVKAISGGRGEKKGNMTLNRATNAFRQPGSTFKVLAAFLPALDKAGLTLATVFDDVPYSYSSGKSVKNWYSGYKGLSTIREGIAMSMNIVAVKTLKSINIQNGFDYLMNLGFTSLIEKKIINNKVYSDINEALPLGGITNGVTNLELTAAYGSIANKGTYIKPILYTKVLDHEGNILLENKPIKRPVMKETTAFLLTNAMQDVVNPKLGTAKDAKFRNVNMPIAGKTGTTTSNVDYWFTGYTPYYVASVWMGYDINKELVNGTYHKHMWRTVMEEIHKALPYKSFSTPNGIVKRTICTESGKLALDGVCNYDPRHTVKTEYFAAGTEPKEYCDVHKKISICTESNKLATKYCPKSKVKNSVYIVRPKPLTPSQASANIADKQYSVNLQSQNDFCPIHNSKSQFDKIIDTILPEE